MSVFNQNSLLWKAVSDLKLAAAAAAAPREAGTRSLTGVFGSQTGLKETVKFTIFEKVETKHHH